MRHSTIQSFRRVSGFCPKSIVSTVETPPRKFNIIETEEEKSNHQINARIVVCAVCCVLCAVLCPVTSDELKLTAVNSCGPRLPAHSGFALSPRLLPSVETQSEEI
jgi:hypothetical protein